MKRFHSNEKNSDGQPSTTKLAKNKPGIFTDLLISLLPTRIGNTRCKLLASQIKANNGKIVSKLNNGTTHLIVDDSLTWEELSDIVKELDQPSFSSVKIVKSKWLSLCLKSNTLLPTTDLELQPPSTQAVADTNLNTLSNVVIEQKQNTNNPEEKHGQTSNDSKPSKTLQKQVPGKWVCSYPSSDKPPNLNKHITEKLQQMADTYRNTNDHWRTYSYEKAINSLKSWPKGITSLDEARNIPGVGTRLAEKIWEIIESGSLHKLDVTNSDEDIKAINIFAQVWGAGPLTAQAWVQQGLRSLEDLEIKAKLTNQQKIGIKHYYDLLERMPWKEAGEIVDMVKEVALKLNGDLQIIGCGSFRRGKELCGDVDILITRPDGKLQAGLLDPIIHTLTESGFLTDHLVSPELGGEHQTYMGVCRLPGENRKHRRIDLFVVPANEFGPALLTYTGSGHFNRSMRLLARKKGMALSHKSLRVGVIRKGSEKVCDGQPLPTPTEESVFEHLGLEYRKPEERDH